MAAKVCESCKSETATVFCRADSAYLCMGCDCKIHAANKLASRHARVWVCEVCEQAPATVTCKADAAHLCPSCDRDIHSANPLARRHDRLPLSPFFTDDDHRDSKAPLQHDHSSAVAAAKSAAISKLFGDDYYSDADEAEAASWLLHNPTSNNKAGDHDHEAATGPNKCIDYLFSGGGDDIDPYLDLDFSADPKPDPSSDGVVPDPDHKQSHQQQQNHHLQQHGHQALYSLPAAASYHSSHFEGFDHSPAAPCKPYSLSYHPATQPSISHSVSSSSLEFGVVPEANAGGDGASTGVEKQQMKVIGMDREARVLRYREKRKNRKFEKTIRYASRKAYAETRPRIKGRFAKRFDVEPAASVDGLFSSDPGYGVVPSF